MISRPTTQQLIDAIAIELNSKVAPAISDPTVQVQLEMAIAVLKTTAVRSANELAWMQEERDAIEETARQLLDALPDAKPLQEALQTYTDGLDEQPLRQGRPGGLRVGHRGAVVRHRGGLRLRQRRAHRRRRPADGPAPRQPASRHRPVHGRRPNLTFTDRSTFSCAAARALPCRLGRPSARRSCRRRLARCE